MSDSYEKYLNVWRNEKQIIKLLELDRSIVEDKESFFDAVESRSPEVVRKFLALGADPEARDSLGTALAHAVIRCRADNVRVLIDAGADVNAKGALTSVVDDGISQITNERFDILKQFLDAGFDVNADLGSIKGYNLYALASDCNDTEVKRILEEHGGKLSEIVLESKKTPDIKLDTLQSRLVKSLRKAWKQIQKADKQEHFYIFGLETDSDCLTLTPFCNTLKNAQKELGKQLKLHPELKYYVSPDWSYYGVGLEQMSSIVDEINQRSPRLRVKTKLMKIFEDTLRELDEKRVFGSPKNRSQVLLMVSIIDADEQEQKTVEKIIRRLNTKEAYQPYFDH